MNIARTEAHCVRYELEVEIGAPCEKVWEAVVNETNAWWLPDFHIMGPNSTVTFDTEPGGKGLVEADENGAALLWFAVQYHSPMEYKIYLFGHVAPDWGGPSTSFLKLELEESEGGCILKVTDAQHGNLDEKSIESTSAGWTQLFNSGLKQYVENGTRFDE